MRRILTFAALIPLTCFAVTPIEDKATLPILSPIYSQRNIAKIQFENGLQAMLISDPNLEQSGAAMVVLTGSWDDLDEHPGIAHFLEHMLFLGTKKYPNEAEYRKYLQNNGGQYNAFTANNYTAYLFTIDNQAFPEALDRFSSFFTEPLFNPSGVAREINAIDQEYAKNLEDDNIRSYFVYKMLSIPTHPEHRFNIGSNQTLANTKQEVLKEWFKKNYSANNMRLIVYSPLPLNKIEEMASQDFQNIPNSNRTPNRYGSFRNPDLAKDIIYVEPIKEMRQLSIIWEVPEALSGHTDSKPELLICHILGHEGSHSLLDILKERHLAEGIRCGSARRLDSPLQIEVEIDLTEKGVKNVYEVITYLHQAIEQIRLKGIPQPVFEEVKQLKTIDYQFPERENLFLTLMTDARRLSTEEIAGYPQYGEIPTEENPDLVSQFLAQMVPEKTHYVLVAPTSLTGVKPTQTEPWLNVPFSVQPIPQKVLDSWKKISITTEVDIPEQNPFVPTDLRLLFERNPAQNLVPEVKTLVQNDNGILYWAPDQEFGIPKISWSLEFKTPHINEGDPTSAVLSELTVKALKDILAKNSYSADVAGIKYEISAQDLGIQVIINGYSQHAGKLLDNILQELANFHPTKEQFDTYKLSLLNEYQNVSKELPIMQAIETFKSIVYKYNSTSEEKANALLPVTYESFIQYHSNLFDPLYVEAILYGNLSSDDAQAIFTKVIQMLGTQPYPKAEQPSQATIDLPAADGPYYIERHTKAQGNAVLLAIEGVHFSMEERAAQQILAQSLAENFFNELRTKQQTGYIVQAWSDNLEEHLFTLFAVQSKSHEPKELLARFELFIESYLQEIEHVFTEAEFESVKTAIITQLSTPQRSMRDMGTLLQQLAFKFKGNFDYVQERIAALEALTYTRFLELAKQNLPRKNKKRLAILVNGTTPDQPPYKKVESKSDLREQGFIPYEKKAS